MTEEDEKLYSMSEIAKYGNVTRQAVFLAIRKGELKARKVAIVGKGGFSHPHWRISLRDFELYRSGKYLPEKRKFEGEKLFDIEKDNFSVLHAAKTMSDMLKRHYPTARIYYLLRTGILRGYRKGKSWIIKGKDLQDLYDREDIATELSISIKEVS